MDYNMEKSFPAGDGPVAVAPPAYPMIQEIDPKYAQYTSVNQGYGQPPPPGPVGGHSMASVAPMMTQQVMAPLVALGRYPVQVQCPNCRSQVVTQVTGENGAFAWLMAGLTCLIAPCCFCIPLCTDCSQDIRHTCPACNAYLGIDKRM